MPKPDQATKRRLAVEASCDPRTIDKVLRGEPVRGLARQRALAVLVAAGYLSAELEQSPAGGRS